MGARPECDSRLPGGLCRFRGISTAPGGRAELFCFGLQVGNLINVSFDNAPPGVWPVVERRGTVTRIYVQTADTVAYFSNWRVDVTITTEYGFQNRGSFALSTIIPMTVFTTADPKQVIPGGSSQLNTEVIGGVPPYRYMWATPPGELSDSLIANPVATPAVTTDYSVTVEDARLSRAYSTIIVWVDRVPLSPE